MLVPGTVVGETHVAGPDSVRRRTKLPFAGGVSEPAKLVPGTVVAMADMFVKAYPGAIIRA